MRNGALPRPLQVADKISAWSFCMWSVASRFTRMSVVLGLGVIALNGCAADDTLEGVSATGTAFTQALFSDYSALSKQAAALAAPEAAEEPGFFESLFDDAGDTGPNAQLANAFTAKALVAAPGNEPEPEAGPDQKAAALRARLVGLLAVHKDDAPIKAAQAQADFDCWVMYGAVPGAAAASQACRTSLDISLAALEAVGQGIAASAPLASAPAPGAPAPTAARDTAPAPSASAEKSFSVYFDFDSWTLKAEQLSQMTKVINAARAGGQSSIVIVGHTDTSGAADYNQKLSLRRANVVGEALVDMGARKSALHVSGVGEADLAIQTADGVKEPRNRRAVITLAP
jgi:outer membrane protein OmpA-like peptidoglycan-associated protein